MSTAFKRILVPVDFSDHAEAAVETALTVFGEGADEIVLLTVYEGMQSRYTSMRMSEDMDSVMDESAKKSMGAFQEKLSGRHKSLRSLVKKGNPAAKIIDIAILK